MYNDPRDRSLTAEEGHGATESRLEDRARTSLPRTDPVKARLLVAFFEAPGFFQRRIDLIQIRLHLFATALVDHLPTHNTACIGVPVPGRDEIALHVVHPLADNDGNQVDTLVQDDHFHGSAAFRIHNHYCFITHGRTCKRDICNQ